MVESRLRMLVMKLEAVRGIEAAPPYPHGFESTVSGSSLEACVDVKKKNEVDILEELSESKSYKITSFYIGLNINMKSGMFVVTSGVKTNLLHQMPTRMPQKSSQSKGRSLTLSGWSSNGKSTFPP